MLNIFNNYLSLLRPKQWIKNIFVIAPLFFAIKFFETTLCLQALKVFCVFCIASSLIYVFNDIYDVQSDKKHPLKKKRPIAAGVVKINQAVKLDIALFLCLAVMLFFVKNTAVSVIILGYLCLNVLYSVFLKKIVIVDVFAIACGFILRIYAGAFAIHVPVSGHIILCTFALSMFLGFSKRKLEATIQKDNCRYVLKMYSQDMLDKYISISATLAIFSYFLYTIENNQAYNNLLMFSSSFVIYGIFRYMMLIANSKTDDLVENLLGDLSLRYVCFLYILYMVAIVIYSY